MDWYTRCITGIRVTPVSTKAVDVSAVLFQCFRPRPAGRAWPSDAVWPEHGIPRTVLVDVGGAMGGGLASPPLVPETLVVDHGKVFVSEHLTSVCRRMGISIQPARLRTGRDKGPVERFFRTLREGLLEALPGYKGPDIHARGGTTLGTTYFTSNYRGYTTRARIRHENRHKQQWMRYGYRFGYMYLRGGSNPCHNRWERRAGWRDGGYHC